MLQTLKSQSTGTRRHISILFYLGMAIVSTSAKPTTMTTQLSVVNAITDLHFALLIAFLILAVYWNSLQGAFIWDDRAAIVSQLLMLPFDRRLFIFRSMQIQNPDVRGFTKIGDILYHDFWGQDITLADSHKSFRPVTTITFRIDHIFYGLSAYGYHISNLLIYIASSLAMYCACKQWVDLSVARLAALIFVLHPIHVEAVASIVGRADCLGGFFYFSSMSLYTKATRTQCLWTSTLFAGKNCRFPCWDSTYTKLFSNSISDGFCLGCWIFERNRYHSLRSICSDRYSRTYEICCIVQQNLQAPQICSTSCITARNKRSVRRKSIFSEWH